MATDTTSCNVTILENTPKDWTVRLSGGLNVNTAASVLSEIASKLKSHTLTSLSVDLAHIKDIDDYGVLVLDEINRLLVMPGANFSIINTPEKIQASLNLSDRSEEDQCCLVSRRSTENIITHLGDATINTLGGIRFFVAFIGSIILAVVQVIKKPKSLRFDDIIWHMKTTGVDALPVVGLISFLLGLIMAFMSSIQLQKFGANLYVASLVSLAMVSELGPIMTAIIVAGRSGSAYAAEISTMKISEEVDALVTMGFDPTLFLAVPRIAAAMIVVPILTEFANVFAICGGLLIGVTMLDLSTTSYINQTLNSLTLFEMMWGLSKSFVFAILISGVGCLRGFQARGGASSVGHAATSAVVTSIFLIVLFDSIFAVIRSYWG